MLRKGRLTLCVFGTLTARLLQLDDRLADQRAGVKVDQGSAKSEFTTNENTNRRQESAVGECVALPLETKHQFRAPFRPNNFTPSPGAPGVRSTRINRRLSNRPLPPYKGVGHTHKLPSRKRFRLTVVND